MGELEGRVVKEHVYRAQGQSQRGVGWRVGGGDGWGGEEGWGEKAYNCN